MTIPNYISIKVKKHSISLSMSFWIESMDSNVIVDIVWINAGTVSLVIKGISDLREY